MMTATPTNLTDTTGSAAVDFEPEETNRGSLAWVYQAISGALVLVLITLHMVAQHFLVSTGLRNFADVIAWLSNPIMVVIEVLFLVVVTWHGLLGLRAVIFDCDGVLFDSWRANVAFYNALLATLRMPADDLVSAERDLEIGERRGARQRLPVQPHVGPGQRVDRQRTIRDGHGRRARLARQ